MTDLVLGFPFAEADHKHTEDFIFGPEAVFLSRFEKELIVGLWVEDVIVDFEYRSVVQKVKKFIPDGMGVEACPLTRLHFGQIDAAVLVAHHQVNAAPRSLGMNRFLSMSGIGHGYKSWVVRGQWQVDDA